MADILPQMDVSGPTSELREKWHVWLRGFHLMRKEGRFDKRSQNKNELHYRAEPKVQDIYENLVPAHASLRCFALPELRFCKTQLRVHVFHLCRRQRFLVLPLIDQLKPLTIVSQRKPIMGFGVPLKVVS